MPLLLGLIAELEKDESAALAHYMRAIDLGNPDQEIVRKVANILYRRGRVAQADDVIKKWEEQGTAETPEIGRLASRVSAALGEDLDRALEKRRFPLRRDLRSPVTICGSAACTPSGGEWQDAYDSIDKAITLAADGRRRLLGHGPTVGGLEQAMRGRQELGVGEGEIAEAERVVTQATKDIEADKRDQVVGQCYELLGRIDDAAKKFDEATKEKRNNSGLQEAAVRFYVKHPKYPKYSEKAREILGRFVNGELTEKEDLVTVPWARRELAQILGASGNYQDFLQAMKLSDANLQASPNSAEDLELRARLLASRQLRSLQKEAVKVLERRAELPESVALETQFFQAQLYLALGDWVQGSQLMASVVVAAGKRADKTGGKSSDANRDLATYLDAHINALLDHDEVTEAKRWIGGWRRRNPKELRVAILKPGEAACPRSRPGKVTHATLRMKEAIDVLNKAVDDEQVLPDKTTESRVRCAGDGGSPSTSSRKTAARPKMRTCSKRRSPITIRRSSTATLR